MAQQIISMAKEETSQDILARVRGLESTNSVIAQSTNTINNTIASSSKGVFGLYYAEGHVTAGSDSIMFELPEDGVERYLKRCYISARTHGTYSRATAKVVIDGEKWGEAIVHSGSSSSSYLASVNLTNYSESYTDAPNKNSVTAHAIGDSVSGSGAATQMSLYLYGKIPFHSLQLICTSLEYQTNGWSCFYYERLK